MFTSRIKIVGLTIASTLISATALAGNAQADTFSINGKALNTNGAFSRIDGQPRVTIWDVVPNDPDQDYQRLSGNRGGVLLKNRKTGNCINAYRKFNGAEFNTWPCNPNDPDQNWQINSLGGNVVQLKLAGTNFCIDTPTRTNGGKVYLWGCDANNGNQRFSTNSSDGVIIAEQAAMMRSQATNRTLDAGGSNYSIYMHPRPDNNPYQRWRFDRVGTSSEYMIISVATGRALDGGGASGAQANLHPGPNANNPFQRWRFKPAGSGYMVINVATGRALDSGGAGGGQAYMHPTPMSGNPYHIWNLQGESNSIIQRAKVWVDRAVSYDQGATANPNGTAAFPSTGYRADCSGFVSMAWGLPAQGLQVPNTVSLTQYATTLNSLDQLQPGDAINNRQWGNNGHVVLFVGWVNKAQGKFIAYEENGGQGKTVQTTLTIERFGNAYNIREYGRAPWYLERKK